MIFVGLFQYLVQQPLADLIIVGRFESEAAVGFYSVAAKIAAVAATGDMALNVVMAPIFSSARDAARCAPIAGTISAGIKMDGVGSNCCGNSDPALSAADIARLWRRLHRSAKGILQVLLLGRIAVGLLGINTPLLLATGFIRLEVYLSAAACGLMVVLGVFLAQQFGAIGVAFATAISMALLAAVRRLVVGRIFGRMRLQQALQ